MYPFDEIDRLIARQGGIDENLDNPKEGPKNHGISQRLLGMYLAKQTTRAELDAMTKQTARDIYYTYFYINGRIAELPRLIQPIMLDMMAVMSKRAVQKLQEILLCQGLLSEDYHPSGKIDDITIAATQDAETALGKELLRMLVTRYVIYFESQAKTDDSRELLPGNIARAEAFLCAA
jgi:lysozyme family protein